MPMSERENFIRNVRMQGPEYMPCRISISMASWDQWREEMERVVLRHPVLFPNYRKGQHDFDHLPFGSRQRAGEDFTDAWGCTWHAEVNGITGVVSGHPLEDWSKLDEWQPPAPMKTSDYAPMDWEAKRASIVAAKARGDLTSGGLAHGFFFMRLTYLRGFEDLMIDFATAPPELSRLIEKVDAFNLAVIEQYLAMGVDHIHFGEDLGTQTASIVSPAMFRKWCLPSYRKLIDPSKKAGVIVSLHSDGHIMELMDCFEECGVDIINPQDLVNGIDDLERECKGRFCIRLDVDRQSVVPFGAPKEIHDLIEEGVRKLGSPKGGLELICGIYPPTPPQNVDAVCSAMDKFRTWWFG